MAELNDHSTYLQQYIAALAEGNHHTTRDKYVLVWSMFGGRQFGRSRGETDLVAGLNSVNWWVDNVELPNLKVSKNVSPIDDGRGVFSVQGDGIIAPVENEFSITFRETRNPIIEQFYYYWMRNSSLPFNRTLRLGLRIYFIDDLDGQTAMFSYAVNGVYPNRFKTADGNFNGKVILLRNVTFACNSLVPLTGNQ